MWMVNPSKKCQDVLINFLLLHLLHVKNKTLKSLMLLQIAFADVSNVVQALDSGFVPVSFKFLTISYYLQEILMVILTQ